MLIHRDRALEHRRQVVKGWVNPLALELAVPVALFPQPACRASEHFPRQTIRVQSNVGLRSCAGVWPTWTYFAEYA